MKELIILYKIGVLDLEKFIEATILYYDIDFKEKRAENVGEILENTYYPEFIENQLENTKQKFKYSEYMG